MKLLWLIPAVIVLASVTLSFLSQRGAAPGLENERLRPGSDKPNAVSSEPGTPDHQQVAPLEGSKQQIMMAIRKTGGTITSETDNYISATYSSRIFRYVDDLEVRRDWADGRDDLWQVRSGSRVGHSDLGANAKRVAKLRDELAEIKTSWLQFRDLDVLSVPMIKPED